MSIDRIADILADCCSDMTFSLDGIKCGIFPSVIDSKPIYSVWYGDDNIVFDSLDDLLKSDFFGGMTLKQIADITDVQAY